jgi:hypothetical protein
MNIPSKEKKGDLFYLQALTKLGTSRNENTSAKISLERSFIGLRGVVISKNELWNKTVGLRPKNH